jgi:flagellar biosynthesis regulator FlbT
MKLSPSEKAVIAQHFKYEIDRSVNGMMGTARRPDLIREGVSIEGSVRDAQIIVTVKARRGYYIYNGGRYATRKVNGCFAPLMPKLKRGFDYEA